MTSVSIRGLCASYGPVEVLVDLSMDVPSGSLTAVLGASGSGKTTLLRTLAGFLRPTAGEVTFGDTEVVGPHTWVPPEKRRVGIVPQEGALFPHLSVAGNIGYGLFRKDKATERVKEMLDLVGLQGIENARPMELSGGQQQRVALARALAPAPEVVLLDEPFTALDAGLRSRLRDDVREVLRQVGTTAILVTHDQKEALSTADQVAVLRDGRLVQMATPQELYAHPADLEVARFVGSVVELPVLATDAERGVRTAIGWVPVSDLPLRSLDSSDVAVLRPEQLIVTDADGTESGDSALVVHRSFHGHDCVITLELPDGFQLPVRVMGAHVPEMNAKVGIRIEGEALRYY